MCKFTNCIKSVVSKMASTHVNSKALALYSIAATLAVIGIIEGFADGFNLEAWRFICVGGVVGLVGVLVHIGILNQVQPEAKQKDVQ